uniref:Probable zinc metalloprotease EGY2, chloroplastic isoform X1 n=1 Tax=Tanacetum cinerariifolium TaxID=118510 RepID=A0A6L2JVI6_TANCI|nr:probable zinc metalloprotease EGY2, chloroplastic isoform X1 [Tanacetum cinerariifolium]
MLNKLLNKDVVEAKAEVTAPQQLDELIMLPKETIDILKGQVFGFDTFFVTSQEPYESGVLFKGNLRGSAAVSYEKIDKRLHACFRTTFLPLSHCSSCSSLRFHSSISSYINHGRRRITPPRLVVSGSRVVKCSMSESQIEPGGDSDDKEKEVHETVEVAESTNSSDSVIADDDKEKETSQLSQLESLNRFLDSTKAQVPNEDKGKISQLEMLNKLLNKDVVEAKAEVTAESDNIEITSGSPLPGVKEPYEGGVLFKGNLRGSAAVSYEKIDKRLHETFGDQYKFFLLINPEDEKPVAVVVPRKTLQPETTAVPEWFAAGAFGLVSIFTLLLRNTPALQSNLLSVFDNPNLLKDGFSGALVTALILGVHEISHILVAKSSGVKLGVPYFVPSWQIGSFGAITRILNIVPNRESLLKIAAAGPLAGYSLGLVLLLLGFYLPPSDGIGIIVDASVFHESFLAGGIAKLLLGDVLKEGATLSVNPLVIWAWAGLLINAINSIPAGELDGGRISFALWGRKAASRFTAASIVLLGLSSLLDDVAFYWVVLIFFLQRGPIAPLAEEISDPDNKFVLSQKKYALQLIERAYMVTCNPAWTPVDTESKLGPEGAPVQDPTLYHSLAEGLQYLTFTRPNLSYAVQQIFLYMHDPRVPHLAALKRILRYVQDCPSTRMSTSGYCVFLGDNLLSWSAKRQHTLLRSSVEAEYQVVDNVVAEIAWLRNLLCELHSPLSTTTLVYCDNVSAVYMSANPVQHQRKKHIKIDIHFVREMVTAGQVRVLHVPSHFQYPDIFTKGLPFTLFEEFQSTLSVRPPPALTAEAF